MGLHETHMQVPIFFWKELNVQIYIEMSHSPTLQPYGVW